jgi:hypothetical protein
MSLPAIFKHKAGEVTTLVTKSTTIPIPEVNAMSKIHTDPFTRECIKVVHLHFEKFWTNSPWECIGNVEFTNGNTQGKQKFQGPTIEDVLEQMAVFIKTL